MKIETSPLAWTVWDGTASEWNRTIAHFEDVNVYQSAEWAKHKSTSGWSVVRLVCLADGAPVITAAQCLYRSGPLSTVVVWVPGGPMGDLDKVTPNFVDLLKQHLNTNLIYIRIAVMRPFDDVTSRQLGSHKWHKSKTTIGTKSSLVHLLDAEESIRLTRCSTNWKRNLKRSTKIQRSPYIWHKPDSESLSSSYQEMNDYKQIEGVSLNRSALDLQSAIDVFGDKLILVRIDDADGKALAIRGALCFEDTAWDYIAITTPAGRKIYASHAVFWALAESCFQLGMHRFDLGGIDPVNNRGVYDFKKGTGATQVDYEGEWDTARPLWFRRIASMLIAQRLS
jgi:lipid II:glycine glycyltransferase (peptidoglycan interpeptide bridge formation enzyme)